MFITLEGMEGSGKTTQVKYIADYLSSLKINYVLSREPGGTILGEQIRSVFLDIKNYKIDPISELLLCLADRVQHIRDLIKPNLEKGIVVICDRYVDSTFVYQGFVRGIDISIISELHNKLCFGLMPDVTLLMDLDPVSSLLRAKKRIEKKMEINTSRFEQENINFHKKVRKGYLDLFKKNPNRFHLIDACVDEEKVKKQVMNIIRKLF